jgi:transposase
MVGSELAGYGEISLSVIGGPACSATTVGVDRPDRGQGDRRPPRRHLADLDSAPLKRARWAATGLWSGGHDAKERYPPDTSDAKWELIEPLLPEATSGGRPEKHPRRAWQSRRRWPREHRYRHRDRVRRGGG